MPTTIWDQVLETERLTLRPPVEADLDGFAALLSDVESARFIDGVQQRSAAWRGMAAVAGSWALSGFGMFSVIERSSGRWIGRVGPWRPEGWPGTEVGWGYCAKPGGKAMRPKPRPPRSTGRSIGWAGPR